MTNNVDKQVVAGIQEIINIGKTINSPYNFTDSAMSDFEKVIKNAYTNAHHKFMDSAEADVRERYDVTMTNKFIDNGIVFEIKTPNSQNDITITIKLLQKTARPLLVEHSHSEKNRLSRANGFIDLIQQIADKNVEEQKSGIYSSLVREAQLANSLAKLSQRNGLIVIGKSDGLQRVALTVPKQLDAFQNDTQYDLYDIIENPTDKMVDEALQFGTIFQG